MSAPLLKLPAFTEPFQLIADACECPPAVGAVLKQGHPLAFYSRTFPGPELDYSALFSFQYGIVGGSFSIVHGRHSLYANAKLATEIVEI
jgi:hypothetical protein